MRPRAALLCLAMFVSLLPAFMNAQTFSTPVMLSPSGKATIGQQLSVDSAGNIYVAWLTGSSYGVPSDVVFTFSRDHGQTFATPKVITNRNSDPRSLGNSWDPVLLTGPAAGSVVMLWRDDALQVGSSTNPSIEAATSSDGGATFSPPVRLTPDLAAGSLSALTGTVDSAGNVHAVWLQNVGGILQVMYATATNGGAAFSTPQNISNGTLSAGQPQLVTDSAGRISIFWQVQNGLVITFMMSRSSDAGATFSSPLQVPAPTGASVLQQVVADQVGRLYMTWYVPAGPWISNAWFSRSDETGTNFLSAKQLTDNSGHAAPRMPFLAGDGSLYVVWQYIASQFSQTVSVLMSRSDDLGTTFSSPKTIASGFAIAPPSAAIDPTGTLNIAWSQLGFAAPVGVFLSRSSDRGVTFSSPVNVTNVPNSRVPILRADRFGDLALIWSGPGQEVVFAYAQGPDTTPPVLTLPAPITAAATSSSGAQVAFSVSATDAVDGATQVSCSPASGSTFPLGATTVTCSSTDSHGNTATGNFEVKVSDATPPVVHVNGVSDGAFYTLGSVPAAGCSTSDAVSGVMTEATVAISGGTANQVGSFTATCSGAVDRAGNLAAPVTASYTVQYEFTGFLSPLAGQKTAFKLGSTIPLKWQLTNNGGAFIGQLTAVRSIQTTYGACQGTSGDPVDTGTAGDSGLRYDPAANQFIYSWQTAGSAIGCYTLALGLDDGSSHMVTIELK